MGWQDGLNQEFARRLAAFFAAAPPGLFGPGSGYRSYEEQARLYTNYKNGVPGQARAAPPGKSQHNHGLAMDLAYPDGPQRQAAVAWAHQNAARFGLYFPMSDEDWHIQPVGLDGGSAAHQGGGMDDKHMLKGMMSAGIDPQDEMASRMHQIMQMLVGGGENPMDVFGDDQQPIQRDPTQDQYLSQMFAGGDAMNAQYPTQITGNSGADVYRKYAMKKMMEKYGWGPQEFAALDILWGKKESAWDPTADNPTSSAAGIAQKLQSVHGPVEGTGEGQIDWGLQYIYGRYGSPSAALRFHEGNNWY